MRYESRGTLGSPRPSAAERFTNPRWGAGAPGQPEQPQGSQGNAKDRRSVEYGWRSRGYLPHFDAPRAIQHITYRLADSLPKEAVERLEFELKALPAEKQTIERRRRLERLLDAGFGSRVLLRPEAARIIIETWLRFDQERYRLLAFVVMPNHCHVLIECLDSCPLWKIVNSWKSYTARWINANVLGQKEDKKTTEDSRPGGRRSQEENVRAGRRPSQGRSQAFWQRDYWDRFIRDERHFDATKMYIESNPVAAGLVKNPVDWPWSSAGKEDFTQRSPTSTARTDCYRKL